MEELLLRGIILFTTSISNIVSKMLTTALEAVPHGPPAKNTPVHKPCGREPKAALPISGHRQLQEVALSLSLQ